MKNEVLSNGGIAELKFQSVTLRGVCMIVNKLSCLTRSKFPYQRNNLSPLLFVQLRIKLSTNSPLSPLSRAFPPSVLIKASCDEQLIVEKKQKKKKKKKNKRKERKFPLSLVETSDLPFERDCCLVSQLPYAFKGPRHSKLSVSSGFSLPLNHSAMISSRRMFSLILACLFPYDKF